MWLPAILDIDEKMEKMEINPSGMNRVSSINAKKAYAEQK
jgi:hypothetical protein